MRYIDTFREGMHIADVYLCKNKQIALTKNGKEYGNLVMQDKTGTIDAKIWDLGSPGVGEFETMDYVHVEADVTLFQSSFQLNVRRIRRAQEGEYVEIYYGALNESAPAQADAISVNKLADQAESVVTNGTIKEVTTSEDGTVTDLLLTDSNGQEVVFHISESTQIYMNAEDLKEGTEISVLHSGAFTMSLPPQGNALEISPWRYQREAADSQVTE